MTLTDETLADARAGKPAALEAMLTAGYGPARRIAHALSGHAQIGRAVAEALVGRSLRLLPRWRDTTSPENWFYHHAVLTTRTVAAPAPDPHEDPLVVHAGVPADPAYVAFVRALRHLPLQQREAFILHHGERFNPRLLGVVMDCSMDAAETHLTAATDALQTVTGGHLDAMSAALARAYAGLRAAQPDSAPAVRIHVRRVRRRRWTLRIIRVAIVALVLSGLGWIGWIFRDELVGLLR